MAAQSLSGGEARSLLRRLGLRATRARVAVMRVLAGAQTPLSYSEVLARLGEPDWDPATTYRNLVRLREAGLALVVSRADPGASLEVWMSHGDRVAALPEGFQTLASTPSAPFATVGNHARKIYGLQFHPEVAHAPQGRRSSTASCSRSPGSRPPRSSHPSGRSLGWTRPGATSRRR
jgi:hypothetical protein